jgi:peptidoglycan/xylan/chitin deacetylase (PgdA/CDA1 family)
VTIVNLRAVKRLALQGIERTGGYNAVGNSRWRRERLLIICYHGVSYEDEHLWDPSLYVPPDFLDERLRILRELQCAVLPLAEAIERLYSGTLPERSVAMTFDDGYDDFAGVAFPILQRHGVPVTVYLPTLRCGIDFPIFQIASSYVLWKARGKRALVPELGMTVDLTTEGGQSHALEVMRKAVASKRMVEKNALVEAVASRLDIDYKAVGRRRMLRIMSPDDVARLSAAGVDFELHTHTHNAPRTREKFLEEIDTNRARLREMTGKNARHFCYPGGGYAPEFEPWLEEAGVVSATTCDPGLASRATPPLLLPRFIDTFHTSASEFRGWVSGTAELITPRRSYGQGATLANR